MEKCVSEVLQDARIVADIGCGPSVIPSCMEFEVVYLVDSSKAMLSIAQSRLCPRSPVITFQAHAQHLPIPDVTCDAVLCCNLLSHLSSIDFSNTLNELCRIVKPEGVLLICDSMHPFPGRAIQEGENIQIRSIAGIGCFRIYKEYRQPDEFLKHLVNGSILINRGHRYLYAIKWQKYPKPT
jgi:ubiquinone/menaquinone biosynthesis C-methylase UbiE